MSLLGLAAVVPVALAVAVLLGAGVIRQGTPMMVSTAAGLLVLLPALGVAHAFEQRIVGFLLGLILWPTAVVVGFPLYFPGERAEALASGGTILLLPVGMRVDAEQARTLDTFLPGAGGSRVPPPRAEVLPLQPVPPAADRTAEQAQDPDMVVLPYEGEGRSLTVPVGIEANGREPVDRWFIFDTGATITTLDHATLDALGVRIDPDAPEIDVRTAGGERTTRLALVDRLWIGGMEVEGVTVSVCDECADDETVGLLGLNVTGRFKVTVDHGRQELVLEPRPDHDDRAVDVAPWLDLDAVATRWEDGRVEVEVRAQNKSPRLVDRATVGIRCSDTWVAELRNVPPKGSASTVVSLPVGARCDGYSIALEAAEW
ncbi:MAG: retropepsin-like domain-containing protein [Alphaproteobacteria bacterium]|nr:retropepsin-like domain-containing protein [Alphaproteobacteria bacterium]